MVAEVEAVPPRLGEPRLPATQRPFEVNQVEFQVGELRVAVVEANMLKLEYHIELQAIGPGEQLRVFDGDPGHFADRDEVSVAPGEHPGVHLLQVLVDLRAHCGTLTVTNEVLLHLGDEIDDVHPKSVDPAVEPPVHHLVDGRPHLGVLPVEVGLLGCEQVQVVLVVVELRAGRPGAARDTERRLAPGRPAEGAAPEVRLTPLVTVAPDVPIAFGAGAGCRRLHKPRMFIACVVDHQVHHQLDAPTVHVGEQRVELLEGSEERIDGLVVADVVPVVGLGRGIDRGQPHHVDTEILQVAEFGADPTEVTDAVAVGVGEAARVDLIDHRVTPPGGRVLDLFADTHVINPHLTRLRFPGVSLSAAFT